VHYYCQAQYSLSVSLPEPSSVIWGAFFVPKFAIILFSIAQFVPNSNFRMKFILIYFAKNLDNCLDLAYIDMEVNDGSDQKIAGNQG